MTNRKRLIDAAKPIFRRLGATSTDLNRKNAAGRIAKNDAVYEAYLFALVVEVLDSLGYSPNVMPASTTFKFRRAPGKLKSTPSRFSYVEFSANGTKYELHCDTYVDTRSSGAVLEVDVCIVDESHAQHCRSSSIDPSYAHIFLLLEAKYIPGGIGTREAKAFLGIATAIHSGSCCDALVSCSKIASNATMLLAGATPTLTPFDHVTAAKAHVANVKNFQSSLKTRLAAVL
jgi:hypothetical protein